MEVFQYIGDYIEKKGHGPTQKEIKDHFELKSFGSVQRYIKYLVNAGLLTNDWNARRGLTVQDALMPDPFTKHSSSHSKDDCEIPLLGLVAAGNPIEAIENCDETIHVPRSFLSGPNKFFALKVKGDSMIEDGILDKDIAIIRFQEDARNGQRIVAIIDGEATLKIYQKYSDKIELVPANSRYKPIVVKSREGNNSKETFINQTQSFKIAGVLVGIYRQIIQ